MSEDRTPEYWFELGQGHSREGNTRTAIECYKQAVKMDPNYNMAWSNLSAEYFGLNDYTNAIGSAKAAIRANDLDSLAWLNLGASYFKINDNGRALFCFQRAGELGNEKALDFLNKAKKIEDPMLEETPISVDTDEDETATGKVERVPITPLVNKPRYVTVQCPSCSNQMTVEKNFIENSHEIVCESCGYEFSL